VQNFTDLSFLSFLLLFILRGSNFWKGFCLNGQIARLILRPIFVYRTRVNFSLSLARAHVTRRCSEFLLKAVNSFEFRHARSAPIASAVTREGGESSPPRITGVPKAFRALDRQTVEIGIREFSLARQASDQPPISAVFAATFTPRSAILI